MILFDLSLTFFSVYLVCNTPCCQVGKKVERCYDFSSHATKETFKTNCYFDCNSKNFMLNTMWDLKRRSSGFDGIIIGFAKEKLIEWKTVSKSIFMSIF